MKKSLSESRQLTYDEHLKIDGFLRYFQKEGQEVFSLLRQGFSDYGKPVGMMAKAINLIAPIHQYCETKTHSDRKRPMDVSSQEFKNWQMLYSEIGLYNTTGWEK